MLQLYTAIWRVSGGRQLVLIAFSISIAALAALPLKFQQEIVNTLTNGAATAETLFWLGAGMMAAIVLSLVLKWLLGLRSGVLGEDIIRLLRQRLYSATNRNRPEPGAIQTGGIQTGTLTTAISAEAEELGKFAGSAFSEPVVQIGTLISVIGFIASTQPQLGTIALAMIAPQVLLVLFSQNRINALVADRVRILRRATDQISAAEVAAAEQSVLDEFDRIFETRRQMFIWKLSTKFLLSTINGAGTVAVLMLGGWLVLQGRTDVGTVVAATLGLSRLQGPTAFLIAFYRQVSANRVKFELLRDILPPHVNSS
ncbi:ABC transporter ATP-binding protein [Parasedimentitalea psychrophila]|uniref:ABC transporter ATP-binding protein n=1 Tax=Parasedimentitalea psychrophila TaxID=2997337 RepID=A0A9Y2P524_9RHOB|nr:ABC transporter ATP-binding protein [Parasedimentitalea psychrophila]WIY23538.1 ABC transporter ATP-binding protein [Parasedimentitalea psychrophila]